jgi:hypothetical protein
MRPDNGVEFTLQWLGRRVLEAAVVALLELLARQFDGKAFPCGRWPLPSAKILQQKTKQIAAAGFRRHVQPCSSPRNLMEINAFIHELVCARA